MSTPITSSAIAQAQTSSSTNHPNPTINKLKCLNAERKKMSAGVGSAMLLFMLGALVPVSTALECYHCLSPPGDYCDDPLDTSKKGVKAIQCGSTSSACMIAKWKLGGTQTPYNNRL